MRSLVTLIATPIVAVGLGLSLIQGTARAEPAAPADLERSGFWWHSPRCETVTGDGSVSFTRDGGRTVAPTTGVLKPVTYVTGLVTLARPNHLLAVDDRGRLSRSRDAGCTWEGFAALPDRGTWSIIPTLDGSAYLWNFRGDRVYRVDGTRVTEGPAFDADRLGGLVTLTADRWRPWRLRGVTQLGRVLDSRDRGRSFRQIAAAPVEDAGPHFHVYDAKIAPSRLDQIVIGMGDLGGLTSTDGGRTWRHIRIGRPGDQVNGFTVAMSPIDPRIVFIQGLNVTELYEGGPGGGRHLYRSDDGGRSFRPVIDQDSRVTITNGGLVVPSPWNRDLVYFEYGDYATRTRLYTLNTRTRELSIARDPHDGIRSIAFNPGARDVMYLGFVEER
ncbi:hypothetical protein OHR68_20960 [Spirillospora sp. NBC_00431]